MKSIHHLELLKKREQGIYLQGSGWNNCFRKKNKIAPISEQSLECSDCPLIYIETFLGKKIVKTCKF